MVCFRVSDRSRRACLFWMEICCRGMYYRHRQVHMSLVLSPGAWSSKPLRSLVLARDAVRIARPLADPPPALQIQQSARLAACSALHNRCISHHNVLGARGPAQVVRTARGAGVRVPSRVAPEHDCRCKQLSWLGIRWIDCGGFGLERRYILGQMLRMRGAEHHGRVRRRRRRRAIT